MVYIGSEIDPDALQIMPFSEAVERCKEIKHIAV
ncbi:MAG: hypothetical protein RL662_2230 [Bacteroidota bacterium]|jgi:hypothetical protein